MKEKKIEEKIPCGRLEPMTVQWQKKVIMDTIDEITPPWVEENIEIYQEDCI